MSDLEFLLPKLEPPPPPKKKMHTKNAQKKPRFAVKLILCKS